jgi:hypothetical protein
MAAVASESNPSGEVPTAIVDRSAEGVEHPSGGLARRRWIVDVGQQDGELVAGNPGDAVMGPRRRHEAVGHGAQDAVPGREAERGVHDGHAVDARDQDGPRTTLAAGELVRDTPEGEPSTSQTGE